MNPAFLARILADAMQNYIANLVRQEVAQLMMRQLAKSFQSVKIHMGGKFKWSPGFHGKWKKRFGAGQAWLDNEVLADSERFTPLRTGTLRNSGAWGTHIGAGQVTWIAPYARRQYYKGGLPGKSKAGPLRGRYWFERSKQVNKDKWIRGVKKKLSGG